MNSIDFDFVAALLKDRSGLIVTQDKEYLIDTRLSPIARKHGLSGLPALIAALRAPGSRSLEAEVVDAMTTNETSFFRDRNPFEALRKTLLPTLTVARATKRSLRIWCAACSTGQEPYSLAMILRDDFPELAKWRVEIIATDISNRVLDRARDGTYSTFEVQRGMPVHLLVKHFDQAGENWRIKPVLRDMVTFKPANLLTDISTLGTFDIILCRNVLIYFDQPTKTRILHTLAGRLSPDGVLLLGGAETTFGLCDALGNYPGLRGVYMRVNTATTPAQSTAAATISGAPGKALRAAS